MYFANLGLATLLILPLFFIQEQPKCFRLLSMVVNSFHHPKVTGCGTTTFWRCWHHCSLTGYFVSMNHLNLKSWQLLSVGHCHEPTSCWFPAHVPFRNDLIVLVLPVNFQHDSSMCLTCASCVLLCSTCCHWFAFFFAWLRTLCFIIILLHQFLMPSSVCPSVQWSAFQPIVCVCHFLQHVIHATCIIFLFFWFILLGLAQWSFTQSNRRQPNFADRKNKINTHNFHFGKSCNTVRTGEPEGSTTILWQMPQEPARW